MSEQSERLKERTMTFAVAILALIERIPRSTGAEVIVRQLAKSATSVAANYRATCNARSRPEFIAKLGLVVEEADESACWLEMLIRAKVQPREEVISAQQEATELRAIFARSLGTVRANTRKRA